MAIQVINTGTTANDETGDDARTWATKTNENFAELESAVNGGPEPSGRQLLDYYWPVDEGSGSTLRDEIGGVDFDIESATAGGVKEGGSIYWSDDGVLTLENAWLGTDASFDARTFFMVFEIEAAVTQYVFGHPANGDWFGTKTKDADFDVRLISGPSVREVNFRADGNDSGGLNSGGGIIGIYSARDTLKTGQLFVNALRADGAGAIANPIKILCIAAAEAKLNTTEADEVRKFLAHHLAKRGHYLTPESCPDEVSLAFWVGESTNHTSLVMDLDPTLSSDVSLRRNGYPNTYLTGLDAEQYSALPEFRRLSYDIGQLDGSGRLMGSEAFDSGANSRAAKMGPLVGFAERERYADILYRRNDVFHIKSAKGGTVLAPVGTAKVGGTVAWSESRKGAAGVTTLFTKQELNAFSAGEAMLRKLGKGATSFNVFWAEGINDAYYLESAALPDSATYQGWCQETHDLRKAYIGVDPLNTIILVPHLPVPGAAETELAQLGVSTSYPDDADGQRRLANLLKIRAGIRDFAAANADVSVLEGDDYELNTANGDDIHPSYQGLLDLGAQYFLGMD